MRRLRDWWRARRLAAAELRLADKQHYYDEWVRPFPGRSPSEVQRARRAIDRAQREVDSLRAGKWADYETPNMYERLP